MPAVLSRSEMEQVLQDLKQKVAAATPNHDVADPYILAATYGLAFRGLPAVIEHCEDVLRRHGPRRDGNLGCRCGAFDLDICAEYESVSRLLSAFTKEGAVSDGR